MLPLSPKLNIDCVSHGAFLCVSSTFFSLLCSVHCHCFSCALNLGCFPSPSAIPIHQNAIPMPTHVVVPWFMGMGMAMGTLCDLLSLQAPRSAARVRATHGRQRHHLQQQLHHQQQQQRHHHRQPSPQHLPPPCSWRPRSHQLQHQQQSPWRQQPPLRGPPRRQLCRRRQQPLRPCGG